MSLVWRVLDEHPHETLHAYEVVGGGEALEIARRSEPDEIVDVLARAGLRGRGGAGFPTATKWRSVFANASATSPTPIVVNGAEGEPSTFKDRTIIRNNPYRVLEGALIACAVLGSRELVICMKESFEREWSVVSAALDELRDAGWTSGLHVRLVAGPSAYLFGEETGLLEVVEGRPPFPRVTPPWRRGLDEPPGSDGQTARVALATTGASNAAPALVNNVETFADVALIVRHGPEWFRELGTPDSPGTIVCTVVGDVRRSGVAECAMGTPLRTLIDECSGGPSDGRALIAVLPGASSAVVTASQLDTPLTHEHFAAIGSALGSAGFRCIDDTNQADDVLALTHAVSRFLSVESCGQCTPCKADGLAITSLLAQLLDPAGTAEPGTSPTDELGSRLESVVNEARCSLAAQHQTVIRSLLAFDPGEATMSGTMSDAQGGTSAPTFGPLVEIVDGIAVHDETQAAKQPDWTFDPTDSGVFPAQRLQGLNHGHRG